MNEHTKAKQRQYRIDHKEELAAKKRIYYERKKSHILEYQAQYRNEHQEIISRRAQEYYQNHRESMDARTRARTRPGDYTEHCLESSREGTALGMKVML